MVIIWTPTMPSSSSYAARIPRKKNVSAGSKKRRFAGKLRKLRWLIYQKLKFKKKRLKRIFDYYKKQVDMFLMLFSSNLKPFEVVIWKQKVTTTWSDVSKYLHDEKKATAIAVDMPMRTTPDVGGSSKLDSILAMLSTVLHLVRMANEKNANSEQEEGSNERVGILHALDILASTATNIRSVTENNTHNKLQIGTSPHHKNYRTKLNMPGQMPNLPNQSY